MSVAAVVLAETPHYVEASVAIALAEERLCDLVHELRQPLSSIEAIAYYLEMTLPAGQIEARQYMSQLQRLVADSNTILERSVRSRAKGCARAAGTSPASPPYSLRATVFAILGDLLAQFRQSRQIRELLQVFFQRPRGSSPYHLSFANDLRSENAAAGAEHGARFDASFVADTDLAPDDREILHDHAA